MFSGDLARSCFAAATFTFLFGVITPFLGRHIAHIFHLDFTNDSVALFSFFAICFLAMLFPMIIPRGRLDPKGKAVFITGCDTGFGLLLAKKLDSLGMHVFAGCYLKNKGGEGAKHLQHCCSDRLHVVQLDVTSDKEVDDAVKYIQMHLPSGQQGLWGIVNNAGASAFGEIEWSSVDLFKQVSDVNVWGVIRSTKAVLPLIRRSGGRVVNMSSGLSRMIAPSRAVYGVSKYAIQGFSDCLRYEMRQFGVKVSLIEPGNYIAGTNIFTKTSVEKLSNDLWSKMPSEIKDDYGREWFDFRVKEMEFYCNSGMKDLTPVVSAYEDALLSRVPLIRYQPMEAYWTIRSFVFTHFPAVLADYWYIYRNARK